MNTELVAYFAGALDADGWFTIHRSTQRKRNKGDCKSPVYSPRVGLGQVQEVVPRLLQEHFGGVVYLTKPSTVNSKPQFKYLASDSMAVRICEAVLPYLRIKGERAQVLLELNSWRTNFEVRRPTYWWLKENPDWRDGVMLTSQEVALILGYRSPELVTQAIANGLLITIHSGRTGNVAMKRIPEGLVHYLKSLQGTGKRKRYVLPKPYLDRCHGYWEQVKNMNKLGITGTALNHRTGHFAPIE
jgi:hypothetical protein